MSLVMMMIEIKYYNLMGLSHGISINPRKTTTDRKYLIVVKTHYVQSFRAPGRPCLIA